MMETAGYNERLFSHGFRSRLHAARFLWCRKTIQDIKVPLRSVLELGCFDGKTLEYLPTSPGIYDGYDANWEGGVDLGRTKWVGKAGINLHASASVAEFLKGNARTYDVSICMETLEHLPREDVPDYLAKLADATSGYLLITVPNELGIVFISKWLCKRLILGSAEPYTLREFVRQTLGQIEFIAHREHKGFSYRWLIKEVEKQFRIVKVEGLPLPRLPLACSFTIGIVCARKATNECRY
jgi:2-polyprenyl-3-methyl-5-hydroxy-6-metoxy-1,4-benzoquinol methylase